MTLTKASQKRSRSGDEDNEENLPRTKRREYNFHSSQGLQGDQVDGAGESHHSQTASTSASPLATSPLAGSTASHGLPLPHNQSADITAALHNTHLDRHGYNPHHALSPSSPTTLPCCHHHHHHPQQHQHHPLLLKDAGILPSSFQHQSHAPLPDVVHETSHPSCYCQVNRLLRSAHFERLKRFKDANQGNAFDESAFH